MARPRGRLRTRLTEAQIRDLRVRQGNLTALTEHHSWQALVAEVERRHAQIEKTVSREVLRSKTGMSLETQAFWRGFAEGIRWFADAPEQAEGALERFFKTHGITTEEEGADAA